MKEDIISLRKIEGAEVLDCLSCSYISINYFEKTRAWFIQRMNNNIVNGKPAQFSPAELRKLQESLRSIASDIISFADNIGDSINKVKEATIDKEND